MDKPNKSSRVDVFGFWVLIGLISWISIQNFTLAVLVTNTNLPPRILRGILGFKEAIISGLFIYSIIYYGNKIRYSLTAQLAIFGMFVISIYFFMTVIIGKTTLFDWELIKAYKQLLYPFLIFTTAYLIPFNEKKLLSFLILLTIVVSIIGFFETNFVPHSVYRENFHGGKLYRDVKGIRVRDKDFEQGRVPNMRIRGAFKGIFYRRATSTFFTSLGYGHAMVPGLLLAFLALISSDLYSKRNILFALLLLFAFAGWFLCFSRSAWLNFGIALLLAGVLSRRKRMLLLVLTFCFGSLLVVSLFDDLRAFAVMTVTKLMFGGRGIPPHFQALWAFYTDHLFNPSLYLGGGIAGKISSLVSQDLGVDSGYFLIFKQMGFLGLAIYFIVAVSYVKELLNSSLQYQMKWLGIGLIGSTAVVLNFGGYLFGGTFYVYILIIWGIFLKKEFREFHFAD